MVQCYVKGFLLRTAVYWYYFFFRTCAFTFSTQEKSQNSWSILWTSLNPTDAFFFFFFAPNRCAIRVSARARSMVILCSWGHYVFSPSSIRYCLFPTKYVPVCTRVSRARLLVYAHIDVRKTSISDTLTSVTHGKSDVLKPWRNAKDERRRQNKIL
jgi:hypothetical protein